jgi:hypothetical protein
LSGFRMVLTKWPPKPFKNWTQILSEKWPFEYRTVRFLDIDCISRVKCNHIFRVIKSLRSYLNSAISASIFSFIIREMTDLFGAYLYLLTYSLQHTWQTCFSWRCFRSQCLSWKL